ncbi:gliding motility-associated C-terminal domain-containing protein [Flammeovirgaceae bacterium SG7u.111]|nr:gliding motility-associated C-terminal domain-containing protein [Flammeovirgaceae bacterium SG7u.132]WPO37114.1 gliding motility-associated C-terminal domain-containing protein [Flammeovirgaceae bacterium SG7u.111]
MKIKKTTQLIAVSLLLWLCSGLHNQALATHIVGGEITLTHLEANRYRLALVIYFDEINGQQGAKDPTANIAIFSKSNDEFVTSFSLVRRAQTIVDYTNPDCAVGFLRTTRQLYDAEVILTASSYSDIEGYYAVYERCCRNGVIQNIFDPGGAGQAFYMEFPPVVKNGEPFINSSPTLFPPLSDYACIDQPFYFDFSGTDTDGDSLAYSLAVPLSGNSSRDEPVLANFRAGPYTPVEFLDGYDVNNMVRGVPSLSIDLVSGELNLTPIEIGLFVFSIRCEEFRDGQKIGEVIRDFQLMVLDCPEANAPSVIAETEPGKLYSDGDTLVYQAGALDNCLTLYFTDPDSNTIINTRFVPLNFPSTEIEVRDIPQTTINKGDTAKFELCLKECPALLNGMYEVLALIGDNSCSLPLYDTLHLFIDIQYPNIPPEITPDLDFNASAGYYEVDLKLGDTLRFDALAKDVEGDSLVVYGIGDNYQLSDEGMIFPLTNGVGEVTSSFFWESSCLNLQGGSSEESFFVDLIVGDVGKCGIISRDTARVKINLIDEIPPNVSPVIVPKDVAFDETEQLFIDTVYLGETYELEIAATDIEFDSLLLEVFGDGFSLNSNGMSANTVAGVGEVSTSLSWKPSCSDFPSVTEGVNELVYEFIFQSTDYYGCSYSDTSSVKLRLHFIYIPDPAKAPIISIPDATIDQPSGNQSVTVIAGDELDLSILADDTENDVVSLSAIPRSFTFSDLGMEFISVSGNAPLNTTLNWSTSCELLGDTSKLSYDLTLIAFSSTSCGLESYDTLQLTINLIDNPRPAETVDFPNAFTPNGDGKSDKYRIGQLPPDICKDKFQSVEITNRWGDPVYKSEEREFAWDGSESPSGVYYYFIRFTKTVYKGSLHLLRGQ